MKRASTRPSDSHSPILAATDDSAQLTESASLEVPGKVSTVLIIQSDPIVRNLLRDLLSRNRYTVLDAISLPEAAELVRQLSSEKIELLIVDREAGEPSAFPAILPTGVKILLTGQADSTPSVSQYSEDRDTAFLQHPFTEARLLAAVSGLLNPITQ